LKDKTKAEAKKEPESALSDTLVRYGVTPAQLNTTPIEIKNESGFMILARKYFAIRIASYFDCIFYLDANSPSKRCGHASIYFWSIQGAHY
jgi:hypothetical protein